MELSGLEAIKGSVSEGSLENLETHKSISFDIQCPSRQKQMTAPCLYLVHRGMSKLVDLCVTE
jgi:hypothetical protein